ncbi:putative transcriptional regulator [Anopheles sinensis]|uniref:Putative transcriptional regulator n=1 Tax=Anopheles sinensis TaxID=74873 RepID=A0A084VN90_ANOSI|nr:putative transcriptional regulator [Anopheles sinensis]
MAVLIHAKLARNCDVVRYCTPMVQQDFGGLVAKPSFETPIGTTERWHYLA